MTTHGYAVPRPTWASVAAERTLAFIRRHALFSLLLVAGTTLRVITQLAYIPAILYIDSYRYLNAAFALDPTRNQPLGYALFIRPLLAWFDTLAVLPAVNHLLGLGMAVVIYALLLRRGIRRWLAALATAPVLLDAYQLQIEQMVMSDTLFQAVIVAALALLTWRRRPGLVAAAACGLLLAFAVWVRLVGEPLIIPAFIFLLAVGGAWWRRLLNAGLCLVMFAVPLLVYAEWHDEAGGKFRINYQTSYVLYARVAPLVDCAALEMPAYERPLCPDLPRELRPNEDWYFWNGPPRYYQPPAHLQKSEVLRDFFFRVLRQQPVAVVRAIGWDYLKSFAWEKRTFGNDLPVSRWRFQLDYPVYERGAAARQVVAAYGDPGPAVNEPLARFLRGYQLSVGYAPGPFLLAAAIAATLTAFSVGRARNSGLRAVSFLWVSAGVGVVLVADLYEFSWRYQLPALVLLPVAGAFGITEIGRAHV